MHAGCRETPRTWFCAERAVAQEKHGDWDFAHMQQREEAARNLTSPGPFTGHGLESLHGRAWRKLLPECLR